MAMSTPIRFINNSTGSTFTATATAPSDSNFPPSYQDSEPPIPIRYLNFSTGSTFTPTSSSTDSEIPAPRDPSFPTPIRHAPLGDSSDSQEDLWNPYRDFPLPDVQKSNNKVYKEHRHSRIIASQNSHLAKVMPPLLGSYPIYSSALTPNRSRSRKLRKIKSKNSSRSGSGSDSSAFENSKTGTGAGTVKPRIPKTKKAATTTMARQSHYLTTTQRFANGSWEGDADDDVSFDPFSTKGSRVGSRMGSQAQLSTETTLNNQVGRRGVLRKTKRDTPDRHVAFKTFFGMLCIWD